MLVFSGWGWDRKTQSPHCAHFQSAFLCDLICFSIFMNQPSPPLPETPLSSSVFASELLFQWVGSEEKGECFPFSFLISCLRHCLLRSRAGVMGPTNPQTKGLGSWKKSKTKIYRQSNILICLSVHSQSKALQVQIFRQKESQGITALLHSDRDIIIQIKCCVNSSYTCQGKLWKVILLRVSRILLRGPLM